MMFADTDVRSPASALFAALACAAWLAACGGPGGGGPIIASDASATLCANGRVDPGETDVDCGGPCAACAEGRHCVDGQDCASGFCST